MELIVRFNDKKWFCKWELGFYTSKEVMGAYEHQDDYTVNYFKVIAAAMYEVDIRKQEKKYLAIQASAELIF